MYHADYHQSIVRAVFVLQQCGITTVPVSINEIIARSPRRILLGTYSKAVGVVGGIEEVKRLMDSDMGLTIHRSQHEEYYLLYNDVGTSETWTRFTQAHELGHIYMGHHDIQEGNGVIISSLPEDIYVETEKEANVFARNLLSPAPLAYRVASLYKTRQDAISALMRAFHITRAAAEVRLAYIDRDLTDYDEELIQFCNTLEMRDYGVYCSVCRRRIDPRAVRCENCGGTSFRFGRRFRKPEAIIPFEPATGNFKICPRCHNADFSEGSVYCKICGLPRKNLCLGEAHHPCNWYASYCPVCGAETSYYNSNLFVQMNLRGNRKMIYDGRGNVPYDPDTKRVKKCPRCFNEGFSEEASYCKICGLPLYNFCEGTGNADENNALIGKVHLNVPEARYCEICGAPTRYYLEKALPDYQEAIVEKAASLVRTGVAEDIEEGERMLMDSSEEELAKKMKPKYRSE